MVGKEACKAELERGFPLGLPKAFPLSRWHVGQLAQEACTGSRARLHVAVLGMWAQFCGLVVGVGGQGLGAAPRDRCDHSRVMDGKTEAQERGSLCSSTS